MGEHTSTTQRGRAVILFEQNGVRLALRCDAAIVRLTAIVNEPDFPHAPIYFMLAPTVTGYEVEVTGQAPGFTIWEAGADPFADPAIEPDRKAVEA